MKPINTILALASLSMSALLASCEGEKDLIIIDGDLPIKASHVYMVGDATPNGWSIDSPTPLEISDEDPLLFTWEGPLNTGEMKLCLTTGSWDAPFIRPLTAGNRIGKAGVADETFQMHAGDPDEKWEIADSGIYSLRVDLRHWTITADYLRPQDAAEIQPIQAEAVYIVGDSTPEGWNIAAPTQLTKQSEYVFTYEGPLETGELKACIETGSWDAAFIRPETPNCAIGRNGAAQPQFVYTTGPDNKWRIEEPGIYRLTFDLENWTIEATFLREFTPIPKIYLIGGATPGGWSWDDAIAVEATGAETNLYIWEGDLGRGELKAAAVKDFDAPFYRPATANCEISQRGAASPAMVYTASPDDKWLVTQAGRYRLTFDVANMRFSAQYLDAASTIEPLWLIGSATPGGWSLDDATSLEKTDGPEGEYTWTGPLVAGEFKACTIRDFDAPFYRPTTSGCTVSKAGVSDSRVVYTASPDDKWTVTDPGTYTIVLDIKTMKITTSYLNPL